MMTRFWNGLPGIICTTCKGGGQERYKTSDLHAQFNVDGGRYEGDWFIRKCITCDGVGAIQDARSLMNATLTSEWLLLRNANGTLST